MKKGMILAALAAAGIVTYLVRKNKLSKKDLAEGVERGKNHLTDAFSRAKQVATSSMG